MEKMRAFPKKVVDDGLEALYRLGDEIYRSGGKGNLTKGAGLAIRESTVLLKFFLDIIDSLKGEERKKEDPFSIS